ncbi:hypothetical protein BKA66DRAFT_605583 [Pyrenochaeta sp. MPI-SDFR-AT-0127]|nr:hypothetical protein BKA66DRAFT_605583 [Pyrenochaeta sp. MPI-SDFR-AT-0127]
MLKNTTLLRMCHDHVQKHGSHADRRNRLREAIKPWDACHRTISTPRGLVIEVSQPTVKNSVALSCINHIVTMSQWDLQSVSLDHQQQLYPAVDNRGCAPNFTLQKATLWELGKGTHVLITNAVDQGQGLTLRACFEVGSTSEDTSALRSWGETEYSKGNPTLDELQQQTRSGFIVKAYAEKPDGSWELLGATTQLVSLDYSSGWSPQLTFTFENVQLKNTSSPNRPVNEPWAFVGKLRFEKTVVSTADSSPFATARDSTIEDSILPIELYAISPYLPKHLSYEGVPIDLLRFALGPRNIRAANRDANVSYPAAITARVFDSGFIYERSGGSFAFTPGAGAGYRTQLTKYLRIWTILNKSAPQEDLQLFGKTYEERPPKVNCMDQTGILGICMSFACANEADQKSLGAYFMTPFGFLHDSPLVGFAKDPNNPEIVVKCNNPFTYTNQPMPELWYPPTTDYRSYFDKHVFLEFRKSIWDACAGPYLGSGDLKAYLTTAIDREEGSYPTKFMDGHKEEVNPDMAKYTANPENPKHVKPAPVDDAHGGILGELHNLSLDGSSWWTVPEDLDRQLDLQNFSLDILGLPETLIDATKDSEVCQVEKLAVHAVDTGSTVINMSGSDHGEVTWLLTTSNNEEATLCLRIKPSFEVAAAERSGLYADGQLHGGPTKHQLAHNQVVSGQRSDVYQATAIAGRFVVDCTSHTLKTDKLTYVVKQVLEAAMKKGNAMWVGNELADGGGVKDPKQRDEERTFDISTKVGKASSYIVQVEHCLDIDWSYSTGNVLLLDYQKGSWTDFQKEPWVDGEKVAKDEGEPDAEVAYRFKFYAKSAGEETIRLCFYDRAFDKPVYRFIDFEIST